MTDHSAQADPGVEATVARPGGISYLGMPARDAAESAEFYRAVFGWEIRGSADHPSFSDGTGHVIGHWRTDLPVAGEAGIRPYIYVTQLEEVLRAAAEHGGQVVTPPYPEGSLTIATLRDPAGNVIGVWQEGRLPALPLAEGPGTAGRSARVPGRRPDMGRRPRGKGGAWRSCSG